MLTNEILFERKLYDGKPLFENQSALAYELVRIGNPKLKQDGTTFNREVAKTKSLISGLLSPYQKRKIRPDFLKTLEQLITERVESVTLSADLMSQIKQDLELLQIDDDKRQISSDALISEMALSIRNAKSIMFFLNIDPIKADDIEDHDITPIVEAILLGIKNLDSEQKKFEFYFPETYLIDRFWLSLYEKLISRKVISPDQSGIDFIDKLNKRLLNVYIADKSIFGVNVCITDFSNESSNFRRGFVFFINMNKCDVTRMNNESISRWGRNVKFQVDTYKKKYGLSEVTFVERVPDLFPGVINSGKSQAKINAAYAKINAATSEELDQIVATLEQHGRKKEAKSYQNSSQR